jgi:MoxR-like ATPase
MSLVRLKPISELSSRLEAAMAQVGQVVLGNPGAIRLAFACLLARGHLLIEDQPGVGKTTLAHALAHTLGLGFQRLQFTSDLLPADIVGVSIWDREAGAFAFHPGPVFAQVVLADEVNRATAKTQSALLEAMEERQVSVDGVTRALPEPFFVIATQNPADQIGTYPLPESQLDRFTMRIGLGYPDPRAERALLAGADRRELLAELVPSLGATEMIQARQAAQAVHAAPRLLDYLQSLLALSRHHPRIAVGLSPRAALSLLAAARAIAMLEGRDYLVPEDLQAVFPAVAGHRLSPADSALDRGATLAAMLLEETPVS